MQTALLTLALLVIYVAVTKLVQFVRRILCFQVCHTLLHSCACYTGEFTTVLVHLYVLCPGDTLNLHTQSCVVNSTANYYIVS